MVGYSIQVFVLIFLLAFSNDLLSQGKLNPNGYNIFYFEDNTVSSEGTLKNGKPDGFWKTYYPNGSIKSQGNRKNFELDSLWIFYDKDGNRSLEISYKNGKKHGIKRKFNGGVLAFLENYNNTLKYFALYDDVKVKEVLNLQGREVIRKAFSEQLEGFPGKSKVILTGYPKVIQEDDTIVGNKIILRWNNEVLEIIDANSNLKVKK